MNVITVKINGIEYNLKGDESEEYLHRVANYVDKRLRTIMENNNKLSASSAAILTAINAADDFFKYEKYYDEAMNKVKRLIENEENMKEQMEALKKQLMHLENYNKELQNKINALQNESKKDIEEELLNIKKEMEVLQETAKNYLKENNDLKIANKELKFQLQTSKYKLIDVQHKLLENQIDLVKIKKNKNPLVPGNTK